MDLISAKVEAAAASKKSGKKVYIIVDEEGECSLNNAPLKGAIAAYSNGSEVALTNEPEAGEGKITSAVKTAQPTKAATPSTKKEKAMSTEKKSAPKKAAAKPAAKKSPAKKEAPKKAASKPAKDVTPKATTLLLTDAQWAKLAKVEGNIRELATSAVIEVYGL